MKRITKEQYEILKGLSYLARDYEKKMIDITKYMAKILNVKPDWGTRYYGHVSDFIWDDRNIGLEHLLELTGNKVDNA